MKVNLKTGEEIECTVQEFLELKKSGLIGETKSQNVIVKLPVASDNNPRPASAEVKQPDVEKKHYRNLGATYRRRFSYKEDKILLSNKTEAEVKALLPDRVDDAIRLRLRYLNTMGIKKLKDLKEFWSKKSGEEIIESETKKNEYVKINPEDDKRVQRMRFINARAMHYVKTLNLTFEEARKRAIEDYDSKAFTNPLGTIQPEIKKVNPVPAATQLTAEDLEFPSLYPIHEEAIPQFESLVRNMIGTNRRLAYFDVNWIRLKDDVQWTGHIWVDFIAEFMIQSNKIAKAFNVPNKFKHLKDGKGYDIIAYEGNRK